MKLTPFGYKQIRRSLMCRGLKAWLMYTLKDYETQQNDFREILEQLVYEQWMTYGKII